MARAPPISMETKMFKAAGATPDDDDNQLIISPSCSSEDDVKNGLRIKTDEDKVEEIAEKV